MKESYRILLTYILVVVAFCSCGLLLFGTLDTAEMRTSECERSNIYPECNPKDYIRECWKKGPSCPPDAANSWDNDTIRRLF